MSAHRSEQNYPHNIVCIIFRLIFRAQNTSFKITTFSCSIKRRKTNRTVEFTIIAPRVRRDSRVRHSNSADFTDLQLHFDGSTKRTKHTVLENSMVEGCRNLRHRCICFVDPSKCKSSFCALGWPTEVQVCAKISRVAMADSTGFLKVAPICPSER